MEKLHSQLPQPLKRCSPSRNGDLLTQIRNDNSPVLNRSPGRRPVTSSPNNIRLTPKQPEVKARSPEVLSRSRDTATTPSRRAKYSVAANGNTSPTARGKISRQQHGVDAAVCDVKQSPIKSLAAKLPVRTKSAQVRTLRSGADAGRPCDDDDEGEETAVPLWTQDCRASNSGSVSATRKNLSPKCERRGVDHRKAEQQLEHPDDEEKNNGGGGSPIYHELDPPGTCQFPVQHTYQSIVEISDELETLRIAAMKPEAAVENQGKGVGRQQQLSRAQSAQELTQKSPTKLSLFSRFRFAAKKSAAKTASKAERSVGSAEVRGQRSLQDVELITSSRDDVGATSSHDRQPSFTTFAHRVPPQVSAAECDSDGYSCVYVPQNVPERPNIYAAVPPRTSSLAPADSNQPVSSEPLYRQKFLKIASVHTLHGPTVDDDRGARLTSSNSVGDLLMATDADRQSSSSSQRVTSYDDHAVTTGSRKKSTASSGRKQSEIARFGLSPGRGGGGAGASFSSPSCGIRMAEMRGAVRRCTGDVSASPTRSPSASTPVPSPAHLSVFQFSVPLPGVMMSPPVHRAFRHVSSQTVMSVRPPSAPCVLSLTPVHGPGSGPMGQMQTIEEEEDDSTNDDLQTTSQIAAAVDQQARHGDRVDKTRQNGVRTARTAVSDDVGQSRDKVAGRRNADDDSGMADGDAARLRTQSEVTSAATKTSKLRRPSPIVASKPHAHGFPLPDPQTSRIVPPSVTPHRRTESSSVSPPSTPRSVDSQPRSGSARAELVRRPFTRGQQQQQQRRQAAPPADCGDTTTIAGPIGDGLSASGVRKQSQPQPQPHRRLAVPTDASGSATGSPNLSSGSSVSLLSTGSEVDGHTGPTAPDPATDATSSQPGTSSGTAAADTRSIQHKYSKSSNSITSRLGKLSELTIPANADRANY